MLVTDLALKMAPNLTLKTAPTRRVGTRQVVIPRYWQPPASGNSSLPLPHDSPEEQRPCSLASAPEMFWASTTMAGVAAADAGTSQGQRYADIYSGRRGRETGLAEKIATAQPGRWCALPARAAAQCTMKNTQLRCACAARHRRLQCALPLRRQSSG